MGAAAAAVSIAGRQAVVAVAPGAVCLWFTRGGRWRAVLIVGLCGRSAPFERKGVGSARGVLGAGVEHAPTGSRESFRAC